ncbi:MAG: ECF transporter S component [Agathobacter sp.]|nr:ECF transporter S component [Agathobacter sp.]
MKTRTDIKKLTLSAMFLALAFVMPFLTGQIPQIGSMLCPMHIPVLLCGFFCGTPWGLGVGFIAPILRSFVLGMPPMFPTAVCMAFELATYGFVAGFLHRKLPKKKIYVYVALLSAMVLGRVIWGLVMFACMGFDASVFGIAAFISGAVTTAIPGIILQFALVPILVITLDKAVNTNSN